MSIFPDHLDKILPFALDTKQRLLAREKTFGHRKCPLCGDRVVARLAGPRNHLHMACRNASCNMRLME